MNTGMILKTLKGMPIFQGARDEELSYVLSHMVMHMYQKGHTVIREGERGLCLYILLKGSVKVTARSIDGGEVEIAALGPGSFFGEMALLSGQPRNATIVTETQTVLMEMSKEDVVRIIAERPQLKTLMRKHYEDRINGRSSALREAGMDDRRRAVRLLDSVRSSFRLNITDKGKRVSRMVYGVGTDITEEGICLEVEGIRAAVAESSLVGIRLPIQLNIPGGGGVLKVLGEVKWCRAVEKAVDPRFRIGVNFIQMNRPTRDLLRKFIYGDSQLVEILR